MTPGRAHADLADLTRRQRAAVVVADLELGARARAGRPSPIRSAPDRRRWRSARRSRSGRSPGGSSHRGTRRRNSRSAPRGQRRAARGEVAQRGEVVVLERAGRAAAGASSARRQLCCSSCSCDQLRNSVGSNQRSSTVNAGSGRVQAGDRDEQPVGMGERERDQRAGDAGLVGGAVRRAGRCSAGWRARASRPWRGPWCRRCRAAPPGRRRRGRRSPAAGACSSSPSVVTGPASPASTASVHSTMPQLRQALRGASRTLSQELGRRDDGARAGVREHVAQFGLAEQERHRRDDQSGPPQGVVGDRHLGAVGHAHRDAVAGREAERREAAGHPRGPFGELCRTVQPTLEQQRRMIPSSLQALFCHTGEVPCAGGGAIEGDDGAHFRETGIRGELITVRPARRRAGGVEDPHHFRVRNGTGLPINEAVWHRPSASAPAESPVRLVRVDRIADGMELARDVPASTLGSAAAAATRRAALRLASAPRWNVAACARCGSRTISATGSSRYSRCPTRSAAPPSGRSSPACDGARETGGGVTAEALCAPRARGPRRDGRHGGLPRGRARTRRSRQRRQLHLQPLDPRRPRSGSCSAIASPGSTAGSTGAGSAAMTASRRGCRRWRWAC